MEVQNGLCKCQMLIVLFRLIINANNNGEILPFSCCIYSKKVKVKLLGMWASGLFLLLRIALALKRKGAISYSTGPSNISIFGRPETMKTTPGYR